MKIDFMDVGEIEKIRNTSKQPNSLMWREHWNEGAKKTVLRRNVKMVRISTEVDAALEVDDRGFDFGEPQIVSVQPAGSRTEQLVGRLGAAPKTPAAPAPQADDPPPWPTMTAAQLAQIREGLAEVGMAEQDLMVALKYQRDGWPLDKAAAEDFERAKAILLEAVQGKDGAR